MRRLMLIGSMLFTADAQARAIEYKLDPVHTQVVFSVDHLGFSKAIGRLHVSEGSLQFDADDWSASKLDVRLSSASLDMGDAGSSKALLGKSWFDAKRFPTLRYHSTAVRKTGEREGVIDGMLTVRGIEQPVQIAFTFNKKGIHPLTTRSTVGFSGHASTHRSAFGMDSAKSSVGDEIAIWLEVEAYRPREGGTRD